MRTFSRFYAIRRDPLEYFSRRAREYGHVFRFQIGAWCFKSVRRLRHDHGLKQVLFVFILTRLAILLIFVVAGAAEPNLEKPDDRHAVVKVVPGRIIPALGFTLARGDSGWYASIAAGGYERAKFDATEPHNWAFFPLYPLLMRAGAVLTREYYLTGAVVSNVCFFFGLLLLHRLLGALGFEVATADRALFYAAIFPTSYFFSVPGTESLFFFLVVAAFLAATRGHWWAAGLCGALASATRLNGLFLLPALALFYFQRTERSRWGFDFFWLALIPTGFLAFLLFLWQRTGNALACIDATAAWGRKGGFLLMPLFNFAMHPRQLLQPWDFTAVNFAAALLALGIGVFWLRRKEWAFAGLTLLTVILPLSSGMLLSMARYVSILFPLYLALALTGQRPRVDQTIRFVFLTLFALMTAFYALRFSFAAA